MRVAILGSGRSYHATRWANGLAGRGIKIGFVTIHPVVRPLNEGVDVFTFGSGRRADYVLTAKQVKTSLGLWAPDLIHCHYATGYGLLGKLCDHDCRVVSVYGADVFDFPQKSVVHRQLLRYILNGSQVTLSTSQTMAAEYRRIYPDLPVPTVTPFGVDLQRFVPSSNLAADRSVFNIGIVKKLEHKYGIDVLVDALAILVHGCSEIDWKLNIVGEGSQLSALTEQVRALGLQERTSFLGAIDNADVPGFLGTQDIFVVPSREESESFGVAAVEAQACGLPVVASDVGGLPEVVSDNRTGLMVPKEDAVALARAIERICGDEDLRYRYSQAARAHAARRFDWSKNLDQMIDIYTRVSERAG